MICSSLLVLSPVPPPTPIFPPRAESTPVSMEGAVGLSADGLVSLLSGHDCDQCILVLDCRPFMRYNAGHVVEALNVHCPPILKRRSGGFVALEHLVRDAGRRHRLQAGGYTAVVVYDDNTTHLATAHSDSNLYVVVKSLLQQLDLPAVHYLVGGYEGFSQDCPLLCATPQFSMLGSTRHDVTRNDATRHDLQPAMPDDHPVQLLPHLYLGSGSHSANRPLLQRLGVTALANISSSCPNHFRNHFRYLHIPVKDSASEDLSRWFHTANTFIDEVGASGGKVLVHCRAGRSRSATVCMAYLMRTLRLSLDQAFHHVQSRRTVVDPNLNFMQQLQAYSQHLSDQHLSDQHLSEDNDMEVCDTQAVPSPPVSGHASRLSCDTDLSLAGSSPCVSGDSHLGVSGSQPSPSLPAPRAPREAPAPISLPSALSLSLLPPALSTPTFSPLSPDIPPPSPSPATASKVQTFFSFGPELPVPSVMARTPEISQPS